MFLNKTDREKGLDNFKNFLKCHLFEYFAYLFNIYLPGKYSITTVVGGSHLD